MSDREKVFPTLTRRGLLKGGAAVAGGVVGLGGFPYINRFAVRAQETPLKFWQFYAPGGPVASQVAWFEKTVADWNDSHPQKIELEFIPNSEYISGPKLATAFASGEGPDIFIISPGDFLRYYNGGVLKDLTPFIDDKAKADFPESVIANRMVDGKIFGIPMEVEPMAMYYSVKAFEEAGLNENDVPKTWEALLEVAKKLTTPERFGVMFETQPGYYQNFTWYPFLWQGGGEFQTADGKSSFDSPATVQALKFWQDAINSGVAPRQIMGAGGHDTICQPRIRLCRHAECRHLGHFTASEQRQGFPVWRLPAAHAAERQICDRRRRMGIRRQCKWPQLRRGGRILRLGPRLHGSGLCQPGRQLVHQGQIRHAAAQQRAEEWRRGLLDGYDRQIRRGDPSGTRAEPRVPPEVYKIISDAIQQTQLGGADPQATATAASQQLDAFLTSYQGAPIL